ncbi:hypothetical protein BC936DRAFT_142464 [Jimgerdemannia flammicorona]|uniref:Uncharacterized protein n=1 Tax=Jimgerdemannia flammicorona TaxID=994334 RepID=A0A433A0T3_9FUNG|nr:hypothetical protein BC936DRAFT_142464 [Jimgerdemannia flammicorona]
MENLTSNYIPCPTPRHSPDPTATPTSNRIPALTPTPDFISALTPEPTAAPNSTVTPTPTPTPTPDSTATPTPDSTAAPTPDPDLDLLTQLETHMRQTLPPLMARSNPYRDWLLNEVKMTGTPFRKFVQLNSDWQSKLDQMFVKYMTDNWDSSRHLLRTVQNIWQSKFVEKFLREIHGKDWEQSKPSYKRPQEPHDNRENTKRSRSSNDDVDVIDLVDENNLTTLDDILKGCNDSTLYWNILEGNIPDIDGGFLSTACGCAVNQTGCDCCSLGHLEILPKAQVSVKYILNCHVSNVAKIQYSILPSRYNIFRVGKNLPRGPFDEEDFQALLNNTKGIHVPARSASCNEFLDSLRKLLVRTAEHADIQQQLIVMAYIQKSNLALTNQMIEGKSNDSDTSFFVSVCNTWFDHVGSKRVSPLVNDLLNKPTEASYRACIFDPILAHLASTWVSVLNLEQAISYAPGEVILRASAAQCRVRHKAQKDGQKTDGIIRASLSGNKNQRIWEIGVLEVTAGPHEHETFRIFWDHFKIFRGCNDILMNIAQNLPNGDKVWSMDAFGDVWRFARHSRVLVPLGWSDVSHLEDFVNVLWRFKVIISI